MIALFTACGPSEIAFDETRDIADQDRIYVAEKLSVACDGGLQAAAPAFEPGSDVPVAIVSNYGGGGIPRWMANRDYDASPTRLADAPLIACVDRSSDPARIRIVAARSGEVVAESEASTPSYGSDSDNGAAVVAAVEAALDGV